jgi:hypothetical protein
LLAGEQFLDFKGRLIDNDEVVVGAWGFDGQQETANIEVHARDGRLLTVAEVVFKRTLDGHSLLRGQASEVAEETVTLVVELTGLSLGGG